MIGPLQGGDPPGPPAAWAPAREEDGVSVSFLRISATGSFRHMVRERETPSRSLPHEDNLFFG